MPNTARFAEIRKKKHALWKDALAKGACPAGHSIRTKTCICLDAYLERDGQWRGPTLEDPVGDFEDYPSRDLSREDDPTQGAWKLFKLLRTLDYKTAARSGFRRRCLRNRAILLLLRYYGLNQTRKQILKERYGIGAPKTYNSDMVRGLAAIRSDKRFAHLLASREQAISDTGGDQAA